MVKAIFGMADPYGPALQAEQEHISGTLATTIARPAVELPVNG
jgi:hypothetical protein